MTAGHPKPGVHHQPNSSGKPGPPHENQALAFLIQRIDAVLDEEARLLAANDPEEFDSIISRKDHLALEAARLTAGQARQVIDPIVREKLRAVKAKLLENASLLQMHIEAVGEISALVAGVVNQATSDGTYTNELGRRGGKL